MLLSLCWLWLGGDELLHLSACAPQKDLFEACVLSACIWANIETQTATFSDEQMQEVNPQRSGHPCMTVLQSIYCFFYFCTTHRDRVFFLWMSHIIVYELIRLCLLPLTRTQPGFNFLLLKTSFVFCECLTSMEPKLHRYSASMAVPEPLVSVNLNQPKRTQCILQNNKWLGKLFCDAVTVRVSYAGGKYSTQLW